MRRLFAILLIATAAPAFAGLKVDKLAEGIYTVTRTEPPGMMYDCNVAFIVNDEDVIVVDANLTPTPRARPSRSWARSPCAPYAT